MATFQSFYGVITKIDDFWAGSEAPIGCYKLMFKFNTFYKIKIKR